VAVHEHVPQLSTGTELIAGFVSHNLKQEVGKMSNLATLELYGTDYHHDNWCPGERSIYITGINEITVLVCIFSHLSLDI